MIFLPIFVVLAKLTKLMQTRISRLKTKKTKNPFFDQKMQKKGQNESKKSKKVLFWLKIHLFLIFDFL